MRAPARQPDLGPLIRIAAVASLVGVGCQTSGAGTSGAAGTTGSAGTGGGAGTTGSAGTSGAAGRAGTTGSAGSGGSAGSAGTTGTAGTTGSGGGAELGGTSGGAGAAGSSAGASGHAGGAGGSAGAGGAAAGSGNPCSARTGLLFCDDFETRASLSGPWTVQINGSNNTVGLDTTIAHSGTKSVHAHGSDTDYDALFALHDSSILPAPNGRFYFRAFVRLGRAMSAGHNTYVIGDLFATSGTGNNLRLGEDYGMLMYTVAGDAHGALSNADYYNNTTPRGGMPGVVFAPSTWVCLEVLLDHAKPEIDVWVDGAEVPDLHHTDFPVDSYDVLRFGFEKYAGPALDVWYDDIAVGTARIGCN